MMGQDASSVLTSPAVSRRRRWRTQTASRAAGMALLMGGLATMVEASRPGAYRARRAWGRGGLAGVGQLQQAAGARTLRPTAAKETARGDSD